MTPDSIGDIFRQAGFLIVMFATVIILPSLMVGLVIAVFQAATQINEQTLSFLPRLIITLLTLIFVAPWLVRRLVDYTQGIIINIPILIG